MVDYARSSLFSHSILQYLNPSICQIRLWLYSINYMAVDAILIPGGFGVRGVEGKVAAARYARENKVPYLGICLGLQVHLSASSHPNPKINPHPHPKPTPNTNPIAYPNSTPIPISTPFPNPFPNPNPHSTMSHNITTSVLYAGHGY